MRDPDRGTRSAGNGAARRCVTRCGPRSSNGGAHKSQRYRDLEPAQLLKAMSIPRSCEGCARFLTLIHSQQRPGAIAAIASLGDDPLEPHDTGLLEDGRAVRIRGVLRQADAVLATIQKLGQRRASRVPALRTQIARPSNSPLR
jgi:hypothetical protein